MATHEEELLKAFEQPHLRQPRSLPRSWSCGPRGRIVCCGQNFPDMRTMPVACAGGWFRATSG